MKLIAAWGEIENEMILVREGKKKLIAAWGEIENEMILVRERGRERVRKN